MGRNRHGVHLERAILGQHHAPAIFDLGNKPIHGGVVDNVIVIKKVEKVQHRILQGNNLLQGIDKDQVLPSQKGEVPEVTYMKEVA